MEYFNIGEAVAMASFLTIYLNPALSWWVSIKFFMIKLKSSGCSMLLRCPEFKIILRFELGSCECMNSPTEGGVSLSCSPKISCTGTEILERLPVALNLVVASMVLRYEDTWMSRILW